MIKAMTNLITKTQIINFCYLLNLPSMVFKDDLSTKIHDKLPVMLFQLKTFETLTNHQHYQYSIYSLTNTLFLAFLSYEMKYSDRVFLCHLAREICKRLYYRKEKIPLYNFEMKKQVIRDMLLTLCSFIDIFNGA
ncbi:hypothetical protein M9Y10_038386 [Tritrichomonas musculus]|uniref:Uncharacterized protein n=1 Tax=Tritrichomonas musculus TaxID=1915356 RepID=A0ABR2K886_9EUKA